MRRVIVIVGATIIALSAATSVTYARRQQDCTPCYSDRGPMAGHGLGNQLPTRSGCDCGLDTGTCTGCPGDNRRVINVRIDSSWNSGGTVNQAVLTAVKCAIEKWNGAKDGGNLGIPFVLYLDQGTTNPDITIAKQDIERFAETTRGGSPYTMYLDPTVTSQTAANNCGRIAHEFGHPLNAGGAPSSCRSIMRGSSDDGSRMYNDVLANDVDAVQKNYLDSTRGDCTKNSQTDRGEQLEDPCWDDPYCGDPCGGDPCCGDPYCGEDPCGGDPCCGRGEMQVCTQVCTYEERCTAYDDCGNCYWYSMVEVCDPPDCHWECR